MCFISHILTKPYDEAKHYLHLILSLSFFPAKSAANPENSICVCSWSSMLYVQMLSADILASVVYDYLGKCHKI